MHTHTHTYTHTSSMRNSSIFEFRALFSILRISITKLVMKFSIWIASKKLYSGTNVEFHVNFYSVYLNKTILNQRVTFLRATYSVQKKYIYNIILK